MSNDYYRGYAAGRLAMQPEWVSIKDHLPPRDGHYYVIAEAQKGFPGHPIGTIALDTEEFGETASGIRTPNSGKCCTGQSLWTLNCPKNS